jgi:hypothetical protein
VTTSRDYIRVELDPAPLAAYLELRALNEPDGYLGLAKLINARVGGEVETWHRLLERVRSPQTRSIRVWTADRIATALHAHISLFDPYYEGRTPEDYDRQDPDESARMHSVDVQRNLVQQRRRA